MKKNILTILVIFCVINAKSQSIGNSPENVIALTSQWKGERFDDGRPKVPDLVIERLKNATLEQIWSFLKERGYTNQIEMNWVILKSGKTMTGRAATAQFMPARPDLDSIVRANGKIEGRSQKGGINLWPIDILTKGDVYVADGFGKIKDGTLIGSSLGNAVYGKTGNGVVFHGSIRDMQELRETEGFNAWVKGHDPSAIKNSTLTAINTPIRIGVATVFPGDIVFANDYGVAFIPAHLVEDLVAESELTGLRDEFERLLLRQNKYASGQIHGEWSEEIKDEFREWFAKYPKELTVTKEEIEKYLAKKLY